MRETSTKLRSDGDALLHGLGRWHAGSCRHGERARWETLDGRWVAIAIGCGASAGTIIVADSRGRYEAVDSYEDALALAASWRT